MQESTEADPILARDDVPDIPQVSPILSIVSTSISLQDDISLEKVVTDSDEYEPEVTEWFLEAERKLRAAEYDPSSLDSFLKQQSTDPGPSEDLPRDQLWGHIDPRVKWPKQHSEEWLEEKRKEIDARGGRKANYKKHLTSQVRKERAEKGWGVHQTQDIDDDNEKWAEDTKALEELFGIKGGDEMEPGVRNGQLVMIEKPVEETGRRRKKPKMYPVG